MTRPVVHFEIQGRDTERLQAFYRELFGWSIEPRADINYATIAPGIGGPEAGVGGGIAPSDAPRVLVYVQVLDPDETLRKAEAMGGRRVLDPFDVPNGPTVAQMEDPEGNRIGLVKQ